MLKYETEREEDSRYRKAETMHCLCFNPFQFQNLLKSYSQS